MIFGVSHLVAATALPILDSTCPDGWHVATFAERLPVDTKKLDYLFNFYREHNFLLLRHEKKSPRVELINYEATSNRLGHYMPFFGHMDWTNLSPVAYSKAAVRIWPALGLDYCGTINFPLSAVTICVRNLAESLRFWCDGVGFIVEHQLDEALILAFCTPVTSWKIKIILIEEEENCDARIGMLDDQGWNCLSLIVNDLQGTAAHLCRYGGSSPSEIMCVDVGGKQLNILFLRGPAGEIVELLEVRKVHDRF